MTYQAESVQSEKRAKRPAARHRSIQINVAVPLPVLDALDGYIKNGDGWEIEPNNRLRKKYPGVNTIDISRSSLIRYLLSAYGSKTTEEGDFVYASLQDDHVPVRYLTVRSSHPLVLNKPNFREYRLISAMVYIGIPIKDYFDGRHVL